MPDVSWRRFRTRFRSDRAGTSEPLGGSVPVLLARLLLRIAGIGVNATMGSVGKRDQFCDCNVAGSVVWAVLVGVAAVLSIIQSRLNVQSHIKAQRLLRKRFSGIRNSLQTTLFDIVAGHDLAGIDKQLRAHDPGISL